MQAGLSLPTWTSALAMCMTAGSLLPGNSGCGRGKCHAQAPMKDRQRSWKPPPRTLAPATGEKPLDPHQRVHHAKDRPEPMLAPTGWRALAGLSKVVWKRSAAMLAEEGLGLPGDSVPAEVRNIIAHLIWLRAQDDTRAGSGPGASSLPRNKVKAQTTSHLHQAPCWLRRGSVRLEPEGTLREVPTGAVESGTHGGRGWTLRAPSPGCTQRTQHDVLMQRGVCWLRRAWACLRTAPLLR